MNKRGQSMVEYGLIAVLVILGIVYMGPYVLRSVNAHFKLWDTGVQDSFTENLTQAPVNDLPTINAACNCSNSGSSPADCGVSPCSLNQYAVAHTCIPIGCDAAPPVSCITDPGCCSVWVDIGCGTLPCPAGGCPSSPATTPPPPGANNNCYYGYQIQTQECGSNPAYQCVYNAQPTGLCALPQCQGIISPGAIACINEPPSNGSSLLQNYGTSYVTSPSACSGPCQYYCDNSNSFFLNPTKTACTKTFEVAPVGQNLSFSFCAGSGGIITAVSVKADPPGQPVGGYPGINDAGTDGCQNPGQPGDECQITVTYGPS